MAKSNASSGWGENFVMASADDNHRLIWRSYGPEKTGKNHLGLSAPGPIAIHALDVLGLEGTVEKFRRQKDIYVVKYHFDKVDNSQDDAIRIRDQFLEDIQVSMQRARTVQVDETEMWEIFRYAEFGDKSDAPKNYDKLNADYREWIHAFDSTNCNLQLIQKVKEKWETVDQVDRDGRKKSVGRPSGRKEPTGFKETGYIVQANISHAWFRDTGFVVTVENCRQNMAIAGQEYIDIDFPTLAQLIFVDTEQEDWE